MKIVASILMLFVIVLLASCGGGGGGSSGNRGDGDLTVGALLSLSGDWSSLGITSRSALEIAANEINRNFAAQDIKTRVNVVVEDTKLDPNTAVRKLESFIAQGIKIVIGPQSSAELTAIKPYADVNGVLLISQSSTASSLAIEGDNIFRFAPDDTLEANALIALLEFDGIKVLLPIWRNDPGNVGLNESVKKAFMSTGGTVLTGSSFEPGTRNFSELVNNIHNQIERAQEIYPLANIAVYLAAFDDAADILSLARKDPYLSQVKWYGSDGIAQSSVLLNNRDVASFVSKEKISFPNPVFGLDDSVKAVWKPISDRVLGETGITPDAFCMAAYDALHVAVLAFRQAGGVDDIAALKEAFIDQSEAYRGATGSTILNTAGDRLIANYDFWAIRNMGTAFKWTRVARYTNGQIERMYL